MTVKELATILKDKCIEGKGDAAAFMTLDNKVSHPITEVRELQIEHLKIPIIVISTVTIK